MSASHISNLTEHIWSFPHQHDIVYIPAFTLYAEQSETYMGFESQFNVDKCRPPHH